MSTLSLAMLMLVGCLFVLLPTTNAVQCYQCNSFKNETCDDPFMAEEQKDFLKDCAADETHCMKIDQNVGGKYRTIRQCGKAKSEMECAAKVGSKTVKMNYCACKDDSCNAATSLRVGFVLQGIASIIMAYFVSLWVRF